jgi:hypothetical protein
MEQKADLQMHKTSSQPDFEAERRKGDSSLAAVKKARKQIETDAQTLANRIALLKQEELKSWKKIEETKKKAKEIYILKKKNEEKIYEVMILKISLICRNKLKQCTMKPL